MLRNLLPLLPVFFCISLIAQPQQTFTGTPGTVTDNAQWSQFACNVSGLNQANLNGTWGFEKLTLNIAHNNVADLEVHLLSPNGTDVLIFKNVGGTGNNFTNTGFKMTYTTPIASGVAPFNGSFLPQGNLGMFNNGQNGNGTWYLRVLDGQSGTQGSVTSWSIRFGNGPAAPPFTTNLPIVLINTNGQNIPDDPKISAGFKIVDNGSGLLNSAADTVFAYEGEIGIEVRGSSSASAPKLSYGFETWDGNGVEIDTSLLGLPAQSDWILSASYYDKTLMRNVLSYKLFNDMGHYASRTRYCELFINGQYQGVYVVMEKIKRDENRVDIAKLNPQDTTGDALTGGYIIKIDKFTGSGGAGFPSGYPPSNPVGDAIFYQYEYPNDTEINQPQKDYIARYVDSAETALFTSGFEDIANGYRRYLGERSFMDLMFLNEMSKNVDGYRLSTYFHKDKYSKGGKLKAGPAWDYDITWMNADYCQAPIDTGWAYNLNYVCPGAAVPAHWERMMQDTLFRQHARCRWFSLRQSHLHIDTLFAYIDSTVAYINDAQQRNFVRWPILGVATWPEPQPLPQTYTEQILRLKTWITNRFAWLDAQFAAMPVLELTVDLGADTALCSGNTVVVDATGYDNYLWNNGNAEAAIQTSQSGVYSVTVSDEFGCSGTDSKQITFNALPNAQFTAIPANDTTYAFEQVDTGYAVSWQFGDGDTSSVNNPQHIYAAAGTYLVTLQAIDSNGCVNTYTDTVTVEIPTGITAVNETQFDLYPNPANNIVFLKKDGDVINSVRIINTEGRLVSELHNLSASSVSIDVSELKAGLYLLLLQSEQGSFSARLVKQ